MAFWKAFWKDEGGQGLVEYAIIIALVVIVAIGVLTTLGTNIRNRFTEVNNALTQQPNP